MQGLEERAVSASTCGHSPVVPVWLDPLLHYCSWRLLHLQGGCNSAIVSSLPRPWTCNSAVAEACVLAAGAARRTICNNYCKLGLPTPKGRTSLWLSDRHDSPDRTWRAGHGSQRVTA